MKRFWGGFLKEASRGAFRKKVIVVFWSSKKGLRPDSKDLRFKYPSVKVKTIDVVKDPSSPRKFAIKRLPTILLLNEGREIDRVESENTTLVGELFRKAVT